MTERRASEIMSACALQFDGFKYATLLDSGTDGDLFQPLEKLAESFAENGVGPAEDQRWGVFFILQRKLCRFGQGIFADHGPLENLACQLYLSLYNEEAPPGFVFPENRAIWRCIPPDERDQCAAFVSAWMAESVVFG
jgi:hypothetical protein